MSPDERRLMRREQIIRFLSTDMTAKDWCAFNGISKSTLYEWIARFKKSNPELFEQPSTTEWIELSRKSIAAQRALTTRKDMSATVAPITKLDLSSVQDKSNSNSADDTSTIIIHLNDIDIAVPKNTTVSHITSVLKAVASL